MWLLHPRKAPNLARKYNAFLQRNGPLPFQALLGDVGQPTPQGEQSGFLSIERKAFAAVGIISIILIIILPFSMSRIETRSAFAVLVGTQGVLVLSALLGVGLPRYAMGMWPVLVQGELLGLAGLLFIWKPEIGSKIRRGTSNHAV